MTGLYNNELLDFIDGDTPTVLVEITATKGSVPRDAGTWMLVQPERSFGTIGGGRLEAAAIDEAQSLLESGGEKRLQLTLGPEMGQCCGGQVNLHLARLSAADIAVLKVRWLAECKAQPMVYIFGAGHVGRALASALSLLPLRQAVIDARVHELAKLTGIETRLSAIPEAEIADAEPNSAFVVLTHDHALDFLITKAALERRDAAYVGLIGSKSKRAAFAHWMEDEGGNRDLLAGLTCPIGGNRVADKRPEVIAALCAGEIMAVLSAQDTGYAAQAAAATG